jgi:hypothetical protein
MKIANWSLISTIIFAIAVTWFTYHQLTNADDKYAGMTIVPEHHKDIPLYKGLILKDQRYTVEGNQWQDVYLFYLTELPELGWEAQYVDSALNDDETENDWSGFYSRWTKEGFDGELWISASYNQGEERTKVIFDKTPLYTTTEWIETAPERVCIYQEPEDQGCTEITDETTIYGIVMFINEALDRDGKVKTNGKTSIIEIGNTAITVFYEKDKEIYFQSDKGIKMMKPDHEFFELTGLEIGE